MGPALLRTTGNGNMINWAGFKGDNQPFVMKLFSSNLRDRGKIEEEGVGSTQVKMQSRSMLIVS